MDRERRLLDLLRSEPVTAAWLFGSHARGDAGPLSDVDVGILPQADLSDDAKFALIGKLAEPIARLYGAKHCDVVLLDEAPNNLAFDVIRGRLLLDNDFERRVELEARIMSRYHDSRHREKLWLDATRARYARGEFAQ